MFRELNRHTLGEMFPVARIRASAHSLDREGVRFIPDHNEWGAHHVAAIEIGEFGAFAIVHYDRDPAETTHLFVFNDIPADDVADLVSKVAVALDLPADVFQWRALDGEMVSLSPLRAG